MAEYLKAMKKLADNLTLAGHPVSLDDLVTQVLTGLDSADYNPVVCQLVEKEQVTWLELQAKLQSYEKRLEQINFGLSSISLGPLNANAATANFATRKNNGGNYQGRQSNQGFNSGSQKCPQEEETSITIEEAEAEPDLEGTTTIGQPTKSVTRLVTLPMCATIGWTVLLAQATMEINKETIPTIRLLSKLLTLLPTLVHQVM